MKYIKFYKIYLLQIDCDKLKMCTINPKATNIYITNNIYNEFFFLKKL